MFYLIYKGLLMRLSVFFFYSFQIPKIMIDSDLYILVEKFDKKLNDWYSQNSGILNDNQDKIVTNIISSVADFMFLFPNDYTI